MENQNPSTAESAEIEVVCDCGNTCKAQSDGYRLTWNCPRCGPQSDVDA